MKSDLKQALGALIAMAGCMTGFAIAAPGVTPEEQLRCDQLKPELLSELQQRHAKSVEKVLREAVVAALLERGSPVSAQDLEIQIEASHYSEKTYVYLLMTGLAASFEEIGQTRTMTAKAFGEIFQRVHADRKDDKLVCSMSLNVEDWVVSVTDSATDEEVASVEQDGRLTAERIVDPVAATQ